MSEPTTRTTQTITPHLEIVGVAQTQSSAEDTANPIIPQPNHDRSSTDTESASTKRPSFLERLPKKEKELLEGVIDRFKALDFSFDVKLFKKARNVIRVQNSERLDDPAGNQARTSASVSLSSGSPPAIAIRQPTTEFGVAPSCSSSLPTTSRVLPEDLEADNPTSPTYLARKIQALLDSLPPPHDDPDPREQPFLAPTPLLSTVITPPNSPLFSTVPTPPSSPVTLLRDEDRPTHTSERQQPPGTTLIADDELIKMLSSTTIMNGSSSRGKRTSVWSVLEDLRAPRGWPRDRNPSRGRNRNENALDAVGDSDVEITPDNGSRSGQVVEEDDGDAFSDRSSIMMYSPLMPTTSSLVELAETEFMPMLMSVDGEDPNSLSGGDGGMGDDGVVHQGNRVISGDPGGDHEESEQSTHAQAQSQAPTITLSSSPANTQRANGSASSWMQAWFFSTRNSKAGQTVGGRHHRNTYPEATPTTEKKDKQTMTEPHPEDPPVAGPSSRQYSDVTITYSPPPVADPPQAPEEDLPSLTTAPAPQNSAETPPTRPRPKFRVQGQRRWVPSTTKLSFETLWWGYRIYLPPPVLSVLSDRQLEATKRAALITTALTWFFSNIPINAIPPAIRPAISLLKTLVPCVGYIGTFISWSWATTMGYDEGYGIILTATWILPVALIPGTWNARDFPPASPGPQEPPTLPFALTGSGPSPNPGVVVRDSGNGIPSAGASSSSTLPLPPETPAVANSDTSPSLILVSTPILAPSSSPPPPVQSPILTHIESESSPHPEPHPHPPPTPPTQLRSSFSLPPYDDPYPSPTSPKSQSSQLPFQIVPPPAPTPRTIPLPEPHSPELHPTRFRPLPDLPRDTGVNSHVQHLTPVSPPPAPSPSTIPLPDIE